VLSKIYPEYLAKGLEAVMVALNPNANVVAFLRQYGLPFGVGVADYDKSRAFMGLSVMMQAYVPWLALIDRKGQIREQHFGNQPFFVNEEQNLRAAFDRLLAEREASPAKKAPARTKK
jgi:hypothetical protein